MVQWCKDLFDANKTDLIKTKVNTLLECTRNIVVRIVHLHFKPCRFTTCIRTLLDDKIKQWLADSIKLWTPKNEDLITKVINGINRCISQWILKAQGNINQTSISFLIKLKLKNQIYIENISSIHTNTKLLCLSKTSHEKWKHTGYYHHIWQNKNFTEIHQQTPTISDIYSTKEK